MNKDEHKTSPPHRAMSGLSFTPRVSVRGHHSEILSPYINPYVVYTLEVVHQEEEMERREMIPVVCIYLPR